MIMSSRSGTSTFAVPPVPIFAASLLCTLLALVLPAVAQTEDYTYVVENNAITITGYTGAGGAIVIPDTISMGPVRRIDDFALSSKAITSVVVPDSITSLGIYAFAYCSGLKNATLGNGITSLGDYAFYRCGSLTNITLGNGIDRIGLGAFISCDSLTSVTIPGDVTYIGDGAFRHCQSLKEITVEESNVAYSSLAGMLFNKAQTTLIQCPNGKIGDCVIPASLTGIGDYAFESCPGMTGIYFEGDAPGLGISVFLDTDDVTIYYLPGTTGWGPMYGDRPTAVWRPSVLTTDGLFGMVENQFGFTISWADDLVVIVEASANLENPTWSPVSTNTISGGSTYFSDPSSPDLPERFYRIKAQ